MTLLWIVVLLLALSNMCSWLAIGSIDRDIAQIDVNDQDVNKFVETVQSNQARSAVNRVQIEKLNEMVNKLAEKVAALESKDDYNTDRLEEMLEKKWEDAISSISNFDPFEDKR